MRGIEHSYFGISTNISLEFNVTPLFVIKGKDHDSIILIYFDLWMNRLGHFPLAD